MAGKDRDRILLTHWIATDWQSLTFVGERHEAGFRITGEDALHLAKSWTSGLDDADLPIGRGFVAEIGLARPLSLQDDGSVLVDIEALTLED
jgi:hypothetical protein